MALKSQRHAAILDLIAQQDIETQEQMMIALQERGIRSTQATISRDIKELRIVRKSLDARKKSDIHWLYTVDVATLHSEKQVFRQCRSKKVSPAVYDVYRIPKGLPAPAVRPVIVGFGPAGMFAGLALAEAGWQPIILERGLPAAERKEKVQAFWSGGSLDPECNVQFGEGGAGTFSDGKLNTGIKNIRSGWILRRLAEFGAGEEITYDAKPHVGTDVLITVVQNLRQRILSLGGEVRFQTRLDELITENGRLTGAWITTPEGRETLPCERLILAIGHSARDTFTNLHAKQVPMAPKPFSMGVRIEQLQETIDMAQYGDGPETAALPPADYKLNVHLADGTSAYTFCMCPGGYVVAAASEPGRVVTNGMSNRARDGENANAALLVTLQPEDFPKPGPLGGMYWQRQIEEQAFRAGGGDYKAPAQLVGDFLAGKPSETVASVKPTYRPGITLCDLNKVLPERLTSVLRAALPELDKRLPGFASPEGILTAPETRSSSPVRILRDEDCQSSVRGLFPCGEGAGYAGGIVSAAVDGLICAEALMKSYEIQADLN